MTRRKEHRFVGDKEQKHCYNCDSWKELPEFSKLKSSKDGLQNKCRQCERLIRQRKKRGADIPENKECAYCKEVKATDLNFNINPRTKKLQNICKQCIEENNSEISKICILCLKIKPIDNFVINRNKAARKSHCNDCAQIEIKKWKMKNKAKVSEYNKKYQKEYRAKHREANAQKAADNKKQRRLEHFLAARKTVEKRGGFMISPPEVYQNNHTKLTVKCQDDHLFGISANNIRNGRWCPECQININEHVTIKAAEHLFGKPFIKVRPDWLRPTPESAPLELDGYNEELGIAIEYNGIQHYQYHPFFHNNDSEKFKAQQQRDTWKEKTCKQRGIKFMKVPYKLVFDDICEYLYDFAIILDIEMVRNPKSFDLAKTKRTISKLAKLANIVEDKEGTIICHVRKGKQLILRIGCAQGHIWETNMRYLKRGSWCPTCGLQRDKVPTTLEEAMARLAI